MKKRELISRVTAKVRENGYKKPVSFPKHKLHISDGDGNKCSFVIKEVDRMVILNQDDIAAVIDGCMEVIVDALRSGDEIRIQDFGVLRNHYRAERTTKHFYTGEPVVAKAHYVPKFDAGKSLKMASRGYELTLAERSQRGAVSYGSDD